MRKNTLYIINFLMLLVSMQEGYAQQHKIDSLEVLLKQNNSDALRLSIYKELGQQCHDHQSFERGAQVVLEGIDLATKLKDDFSLAVLLRIRGQIHKELFPSEYEVVLNYFVEAAKIHHASWLKQKDRGLIEEKERARLIHNIGYLYWQWGKLYESLRYYDSAANISGRIYARDSTDLAFIRLRGMHHNGKGAVLWGLGIYNESIIEYQKALVFFRKIDQNHLLSLTTSNMGLVYDSWGQQTEALKYFKAALELALKSERSSTIAYANSNIGKFMEETEQYDSAIYYYQKAIDLYIESKRPDGIGLGLNRLGNIQLKQGNYNEALQTFFKALEMSEASSYSYWIAMSKHNISSALISKGDLGKALAYARESNQLSEQGGFKEITKDNYLNITQIYEQLGNYKEAYNNFLTYTAIKDSLFSEEKFKQITLLNEQAELAQKEQENELLRRDKMIQESELDRAKAERFALISLVIVLASFAGFFVISRSKIKKVNRDLTISNLAVTNQKEALSNQRDELKKTNEIKDLMLSIVSHDMRGPIHNIEQLINMLNNKMITADEFRNLLPNIASSISYISNLTDNLLYWARSQMEGTKINPSVIDIYDIVNDKLALFEKIANDKGIHFNNQIQAGSKVFADPYMVELVLRNLVSNAIKFCNTGDSIILSAKPNNDNLTVLVKDTGMGIPPEDIDKIFQSAQFSTPGTKNERGAGLGLSICKHFITLNKGKIWVESVYRKGSSFYFSLPQA